MKKKTWLSLGILAAGALAICAWFTGSAALNSADELSPAAVVSGDAGDEERRTARTRSPAGWVAYFLRTALMLPITVALGTVRFVLRGLLDAALLPLARFLGGWAFSFAVLLGLFCLLFRLLFPQRRLREFLRWKNIRWMLLGSFLLPGADAALRYWCEGYNYLRAAAMTLVLCAVVLFIWLRCFGSPLGAGARLRALLWRRHGWVLPVTLVIAALLYGWAGANVSHETLEQSLIGACWFYGVAAATVGAVAVHRLQKRAARQRAAHSGTSLSA